MPSPHVSKWLSEYIDNTLDEKMANHVRGHLAACRACGEEERRLIAMWKALSRTKTISLSPDFSARFWSKLRRGETPARLPGKWDFLLDWRSLAVGAMASVIIGLATGSQFSSREPGASATEQGVTLFVTPQGFQALAEIFVEPHLGKSGKDAGGQHGG